MPWKNNRPDGKGNARWVDPITKAEKQVKVTRIKTENGTVVEWKAE